MARDVESINTFTRSRKFDLDKEKTVIRCGDGAIYELEKAEGSPAPRFVRGFQPDGSMTHVSGAKILPAAVEETVNSLFERWDK